MGRNAGWMAGAWLAAMLAAAGARAQSTDGFHAIQVLPVVVDTASFTQRISLRTPNRLNLLLQVDYYPAEGTAQATPLSCNTLLLPGLGDLTVESLRAVCPGLAEGSNFGTLIIRASQPRVFSVYSRVSNPQGAGFSVEGFAANSFNPAIASVTGLRRLAATANSPAYQSNCFVGNLAEYTPAPNPPASLMTMELRQNGTGIGFKNFSLRPGQMLRFLDIFSAAGLTVGDYDDVTARFTPVDGSNPAMVAFCTVQDNTSFGADFRIAKTEVNAANGLGWNDYSQARAITVGSDYKFTGTGSARSFAIPAGATRNVHTLYFRHPDLVSCTLLDGVDAPTGPEYGLEMRLLGLPSGSSDWAVLAGGNDVQYFSALYLGDKGELNEGYSSRYMLEVESNGQQAGINRPYKIRCVSGSGHTLGELSLTGAPLAF